MPVFDSDLLSPLIDALPDTIFSFKEQVGNIMKGELFESVFAEQGPQTRNTDPLNPGGVNPQWPPLSPVTIMLKGSSGILMDLGLMRASARWEISDSEIDGKESVVKFGWHEEAGDRVWIAAIHEFGLTGTLFNTPQGITMGGEPIGRTAEARAKIRWWYRRHLGMSVSGVIKIPRRSMLGKTADLLVASEYEKLLDIAILETLNMIGGGEVDLHTM
jgi:hypothetical protein